MAEALSTVASCPVRGRGGDAGYPGNWGANFVARVLGHLQPRRVMDVMSGSGTTGDVAEALGIPCDCYDLRPAPPRGMGDWNVQTDEPSTGADLILAHWPYWTLVRYSAQVWGKAPDPRDLSCVESWEEFLARSGRALGRMMQWVDVGGYVGVLVGSIRRDGRLWDTALDIPRPAPVAFRLVKVQHNMRSTGRTYPGKVVPILHEDFLVFQRTSPYLFAGVVPRPVRWDLRRSAHATWRGAVYAALMALGGEADLAALYREVQGFAIARGSNAHWREKVRQTLQRGGDFEPVTRGRWKCASQAPAA